MLLATYPPEQRPIADQLAQGGLAAVRKTLAEEQAAAKAAGRSVENNDAILAVAEQMLPAIRQAVWLDRAEAAVGALETITLRDLRATVAGAAPRDDIGRELLSKLREALNERLNKLRTGWETEIAKALDEDRTLQALRLSARPPEPTTRFPAALVERLVATAGSALDASVPKERWLALLEAASNSPVRRSIHPAGIPEDASGALRQAATEAAGRIPALAKLLGLAMPPPPRPSAQRPLPPRPPRPPMKSPTATSSSPTDSIESLPAPAPASAAPEVVVLSEVAAEEAQPTTEDVTVAEAAVVEATTAEETGVEQVAVEETASEIAALDENADSDVVADETVADATEGEEQAPEEAVAEEPATEPTTAEASTSDASADEAVHSGEPAAN
jgi:hypothetical protein